MENAFSNTFVYILDCSSVNTFHLFRQLNTCGLALFRK
uniref:Uncharacterized protein n=1 Tax=Arundo donax TaxID=35708 RepID=A0A0A8Y7T1_ARUDO